jgi:hypothetical protein
LGVRVEVRGMDMEEEVKEAYELVKRIDVLDVSVSAYTYSFRFILCVMMLIVVLVVGL